MAPSERASAAIQSFIRRFLHNVPRVFVISPAEKDSLPHLFIFGPFGERDLTDQLWLEPTGFFRELLVDFQTAIFGQKAVSCA